MVNDLTAWSQFGGVRLTPDSERRALDLRRALTRGVGLVIVIVDGGARAEVLRRLATWSGRDDVPELRIVTDDGEALKFLQDLRGLARCETGIVIANPGLSVWESPCSLREWNPARDLIARYIDGPCLFVIEREHEVATTRAAPDLYDVRAGTYRFESESLARERLPSVDLGEYGTVKATPPADLRKREADLREMEEDTDVSRGLLADEWLRVAKGWHRALSVDPGAYDAAVAAAGHAQALAAGIGYVRAVALAIRLLGDFALFRSNHTVAQSYYESALPLCQQVGDVQGAANCMVRLGEIDLRQGDLTAAKGHCDYALRLYRELGDTTGAANAIARLGEIAHFGEDYDAAQSLYKKAIAEYRRVDGYLGIANCLLRLGEVALARDRYDEASLMFSEVLPLYQHIGDSLGEANAIKRLGDIAFARSDHEGARARYEEALRMYAQIPEPYSMGWLHMQLGEIGDGEERAAHIAEARRLWLSIDRPDLVKLLDDALGQG
jgi:tetratricopeptide (TPR) repeat protein